MLIVISLTGTIFTPTTGSSTEEIRQTIIQSFSPPLVSPDVLNATADKLLELYPDDPALGSPYGTGVQTFELPDGFKRQASLCTSSDFPSIAIAA